MNTNQIRDTAIYNFAIGLNYFGKKLAATKEAVFCLVCEEFASLALPEEDILSIIEDEHENTKTEKAKAKNTAAKRKKVSDIDNRPVSAGALSHSENSRSVLAGKKFIVTSCQNNTDIHQEFLRNLEAYANHLKAELIIFPFTYNLNGFQNGVTDSEEIYYDGAVKPYLQSASVWLGESLKVAAMNFNILPTVKNPLSGMKEAIGTAQALIIPHATIAHENIAVLGAQFGAIVPSLYSTGCLSQMNYIQKQAGHKAENRHNFGALIVEYNDQDQFWVRQIETDYTGVFYDLGSLVQNGEIEFTTNTVEVLNYGDIHAEKIDEKHANFLWCDGGFLDTLRPRYQMMHDLCDFSSMNHHNRENHYHRAKNQANKESVQNDMMQVCEILDSSKRDFCKTIIVRSNHDTALDSWLVDNKYEPRKDAVNASFYYSMQVMAYACIEKGTFFDSLPHALNLASFCTDYTNSDFKFLKASESFKIKGVELGEHGHSGTNGSRGSPKQFSSNKMTTGHTHSPSIYNGCYTAGVTGKLAMGYNETGASSWVQAHVIQYVNGFRAIIAVKDNGAGNLASWA